MSVRAKVITAAAAESRAFDVQEALADLKELLKPGISIFVVVVAAAGYLVGLGTAPIELSTLTALLTGVFMTAGGSGALNHLIERHHDAKMRRTMARPLPGGRLGVGVVAAYGTVLNLVGLSILCVWVNHLTAGLALSTSLSYLLLYTPLKRVSAWNTLVGAVPGALPALGGFAGATNGVGAGGWALFAVIFLWQLPHFFALAWIYRDDYARGGFRMLPGQDPTGAMTATAALVAALLLVIAGVVPTALGLTGWVYFFGMLALGTWFTLPAFAFFREPSHLRARRLLLASILYVPVFFTLVVIDYLLRLYL
ncbi:MAG: heme o synthase [Bacteroidota bacterium]